MYDNLYDSLFNNLTDGNRFTGTDGKTLNQLLKDTNHSVKFIVENNILRIAIKYHKYSSYKRKQRNTINLYNTNGSIIKYNYVNWHRCISYEKALVEMPEYFY